MPLRLSRKGARERARERREGRKEGKEGKDSRKKWERKNASHCRHGKEIRGHNTLAKRTHTHVWLFGMLPAHANTCTYNFIHTQYVFPFHSILFNNTQGKR